MHCFLRLLCAVVLAAAAVSQYNSADDKLAIAQKYMPQAEKALDEARRMRVPPRYEAEKAKYIKMFEMLLASAKLSVKFAEKTGMGRGASK